MFSPLTTLVSVLLVALSGVLIAQHRRHWLTMGKSLSGERETHFAQRQLRRRVQTSGMLGLGGLAIFIGQFITAPQIVLWYWAGVVLLVLWTMLLAMADVLATHAHFGRLRRENLDEQVRLQAEIHRRRGNSNGPSLEPDQPE